MAKPRLQIHVYRSNRAAWGNPEVAMLADQIDPILADLIRRRVPFSHHDVIARMPSLSPEQAEEVRLLVIGKMIGALSYRLSVVRFVGEGLTLICTP